MNKKKQAKLPRAFYREIGRKGGRAGKGSEKRRQAARTAAEARWKSHKTGLVRLSIDKGQVRVSRYVPGLNRLLSAVHRRRKGEGKIQIFRQPLIFKCNGKTAFSPKLLPKVVAFLKKNDIPYRLKWITKPAFMLAGANLDDAVLGVSYQEGRQLKRLMRSPFGALCRIEPEQKFSVIEAVARGFWKWNIVIVVKTVARLEALRTDLQHFLHEPIGMLASGALEGPLDQERVTLITPAYLSSRVIAPQDCGVLIFDQVPRTSLAWLSQSNVAFPMAWTLGFIDYERRGHERMLIAESYFGPLFDFGSRK